MAYNYYLVYFNENNKTDTGTNVYASNEEQAKEIGAVLLSRHLDVALDSEDMFAEVNESLQQDTITTT